jgi:hypothetical protein
MFIPQACGRRLGCRNIPLLLLAAKKAGYEDEKQRDKNKVNERGGKHSADNRRSNGILGPCSGSRGYR